jgi:hypothetical protein
LGFRMVGMKIFSRVFFLPVLLLVGIAAGQTPIKVPPLPIPLTAVMHVDTLSLSAASTAGATTANMTLAAVPISSMGALCLYQTGGQTQVTPSNTIQQTIVFTLPQVPQATDSIQMVYWSTK